jgi:hypothetical protein
VKDTGENAGGKKGNWSEGVAQRGEKLHGCTHFLIDRGNGRDARTSVMNDGLEMVKSEFNPGKYIGERGNLHVT